MASSEEEKTQLEATKQADLQGRLDWEGKLRAELEEEKSRRRREQAEYHSQVSQQRGQNCSLTARREEYEQSLFDQVRRNQKYLQEIDERETRQPLDKAHFFRK